MNNYVHFPWKFFSCLNKNTINDYNKKSHVFHKIKNKETSSDIVPPHSLKTSLRILGVTEDNQGQSENNCGR